MQHINYCSQGVGGGWAYHCTVFLFCHIPMLFLSEAKNQKEGTLEWVNMGNDLTQELVFLSLPTTN
jgi:hypothetical protein